MGGGEVTWSNFPTTLGLSFPSASGVLSAELWEEALLRVW